MNVLSNGDVLRLRNVVLIGEDEFGNEVHTVLGKDFFITAQMRPGEEQVQRNGAGAVAVSYKTPDVFGHVELVAPRDTRVARCEACSGDGHVEAADHVYWAADGEVGCLKCVARDAGHPCPVCKGEGTRK